MTDLTAVEIVQAVAERRLSVVEVVESCLRRVEAFDNVINAVCTVNPTARVEALIADARLATGAPVRRLEGVPFVVKDNIPTAGLRTTFGSLIYGQNVPHEDGLSVERLRGAGGILLGKTNTSEFASDVNTSNRVFGTTRNPWNPNFTSGGSSGGTAAAIAARMVPIGLGTDLGGSVRVPSSYCGILGLRPAPGRIPIYPSDFVWNSLVPHVEGPLARSVPDLGLMLAVISGIDDRDPNSLPDPLQDYANCDRSVGNIAGSRIAYTSDLNGLFPVDTEVAQLVRTAVAEFETLGYNIEEDCFDTSDVREIAAATRAFGLVALHADHLTEAESLMTPQLVAQVKDALKFDFGTVPRTEKLRSSYWHKVQKFLTRYDYILLPTVGAPAFRLDQPLPTEIGGKPIARYHDVFFATYAFSLIGLPALSMPCGFTKDGLPVGLQIVGRRLQEDRVLAAAASYLAVRPDNFRAPTLARFSDFRGGADVTLPPPRFR